MGEPRLPAVVVVTGTDTDVGKTVVTAAVVALLVGVGLRVTAYKPTQTGVAPGESGDMGEVERLTGVPTSEGTRLRAPMAPRPAARLEGAALPTLADHVDIISDLSAGHDVVVVEGAGGLLVELTDDGETLADLAAALPDSGAVLVVRSALGTLNHTMLTREALSHRSIRLLGLVLGAWPSHPDMIETTNLDYLSALPEGLLGQVPRGAPALSPDVFRGEAPTWLPGLTGMAESAATAQRRGTP
ncbi:dethiobiotin synthase [Terrabacter terrigena]|uniref:ATP-dependent dethiobiotin synthetase BioD n=1 Tax=Terrabacter terrigena TaxID=574718 RepID=A0ABW3MS61_9MICO